ncbi:DUF551 domain-containing protein [Christensenellaceae bacterium OttesenSCG-928-M15]|nr:DUF551 domain-containing protein [Christensenellaceae bacterium OttesenSCG-928-M15]
MHDTSTVTWHKCSEKLPSAERQFSFESKKYLVTLRFPQGLITTVMEYVSFVKDRREVEMWKWEKRYFDPTEPIHWAELPSPPAEAE